MMLQYSQLDLGVMDRPLVLEQPYIQQDSYCFYATYGKLVALEKLIIEK